MRAIIKTAIRIILIVLFIQLLRMVMTNVQEVLMYARQGIAEDGLYFGLIIGGAFVLGTLFLLVLWWKTDWLVRILSGNADDTALTITTSGSDLFNAVLRVVGVYLLVTSVPDLLGLAVYHFTLDKEAELIYTPNQQAIAWQHLVKYLITIGIGLWLVLGARGISRVIENLRNAPISKSTEEQ